MDNPQKRSWTDILFDAIEVWWPCVIFVFLFVSYMILIACRYLFHSSVDWLYEANTIAFVWCGIFAAAYGSHKGTHVQFTILYDKLPPRARLALRIIGALVVIILFCLLLPRAVDNMRFMRVRKSSVLKTTFDIIFFPFLIYLGLTIYHNLAALVRDLRKSPESGGDKT